jgi:ABC-type branched-subunit amino acid transport system substrate-binding protein
MESVGFKADYSRAIEPTDTQFTSDVIRMRAAGVSFLYLGDTDVEQNAQFLDQAYQQHWRPKVILLSTAYDANFFKLVNPAAVQGALMTQVYSLFLGEDAKAVPEVAKFLKWVKVAAPGFNPDLYTMFSWASAALFVQALRTMGKNPTQVGLIKALKNIHAFTDNGMIPASDVGNKKPPTGFLMAKVENGKWVRTNPPKSGFIYTPNDYYFAK